MTNRKFKDIEKFKSLVNIQNILKMSTDEDLLSLEKQIAGHPSANSNTIIAEMLPTLLDFKHKSNELNFAVEELNRLCNRQ